MIGGLVLRSRASALSAVHGPKQQRQHVSRQQGVVQQQQHQQQHARRRRRRGDALCARAAAAEDDGAGGGFDADAAPSTSGSAAGGGGDQAAAVAALNKLFRASVDDPLTGEELTRLIRDKWGGRSHEARIVKRGQRVYLQVMWKFLEQQSFHMTKEQYDAQMAAVADVVTEWGAADTVRRAIAADRSRGPGYTGGTSARAVSIPLEVDTSGARSREWRY